jgi:hypothetical protein
MHRSEIVSFQKKARGVNVNVKVSSLRINISIFFFEHSLTYLHDLLKKT